MNGYCERNITENTVTISVVTYNSGRYIGGLLRSLMEHTKDIDFHIYIFDNGSTDNTLETVMQMDSDHLTVIKSGKNLGYGSGHNQVFKDLNSKYHLIINPDVKVIDNIVSRLVGYLESNLDIGIVTPKVLCSDGEIQLLPKRDPRIIYLLSRRIDIPFLRKYRHEYEMLNNDFDTPFDIEFCTGAFMFVRTSLLKKVGGFDERYFMYFEDADLTRKIRQFARAVYNPEFVVYHEWERAGSKQLKFLLIQIWSMVKYLTKWRRKKNKQA